MSNFFKILRIRLDERLDISRFKHSTDSFERMGIILYKLVKVIVAIVMFLGITILYEKLALAGLAKILPTMSYFLASIVCVFVTIVNINEILTGNEDSEFLLSTPISNFVHVAIMFLTLYIRGLAVVLLICTPAAIMYIKYVDGIGFLGYWVLGALLTCLPLGGIACLAGTVIVLTLAHNPKKEQIQSGITMLFIAVGCGVVLFLVNRIDAILTTVAINSDEAVTEILRLFMQNFRFTRMYQYAIVEHSVGYLIVFPILSVIWYGVFAFAFGMGYRVMIISFRCPVDYRKYQWRVQKKNTIFNALLKREIHQLLRSKTYMVRSLSGILMGSMMVFSTLIFGADLLQRVFHTAQIIPMLCLFIGMGNTTYCSFSIEGRKHWIMETAPIDKQIVYRSKVCANLIFTLPYAIAGGAVLGYTMQVTLLWKVLFILIPCAYAVGNACLGIFIDDRFGRFDKESEQQAMQQGLSYVFGYLPGIVFPICCLFLL